MKKSKDINTEQRILIAAKDIFHEKGMNGARMQEIADKAKINKALLHYYFRSKQLLFKAVFQQAFALLSPQLNQILNDDSSLPTKIEAFCKNYISFMTKHPYLPNFVLQELNRNPEFIDTMTSTSAFPNLEKFKIQVLEEIEQGHIHPIDPTQLFINIMSLNILPFIAKPLIKGVAMIDEERFQQLLNQRKTEVSSFIINAIKR